MKPLKYTVCLKLLIPQASYSMGQQHLKKQNQPIHTALTNFYDQLKLKELGHLKLGSWAAYTPIDNNILEAINKEHDRSQI